MLKHWIIRTLLVTCLGLTACNTATPTPETVEPTISGGNPPATLIGEAPTPEVPATSAPTNTTIATDATETVPPATAASVEPTGEATAEATAEATLEATSTVVSDSPWVMITELASPDQAWLATVIYDVEPFPNEILFWALNQNTGEELLIESLTGSDEATIPYSPYPMAWDAASETVFYFHYPVYMDGCAIYDGSALYGYNVATNTGAVLNDREGFYFKFSPDASRLAYLPSNDNSDLSTIAVYNTSDDTLQEAPFADNVTSDPADEVMADIFWNPTRPIAAAVVMVNMCMGEGAYHLILLDTDTMEQTELDVDAPFGYTIDGWDGDNDNILLVNVDNTIQRYDIDAGAWVE